MAVKKAKTTQQEDVAALELWILKQIDFNARLVDISIRLGDKDGDRDCRCRLEAYRSVLKRIRLGS